MKSKFSPKHNTNKNSCKLFKAVTSVRGVGGLKRHAVGVAYASASQPSAQLTLPRPVKGLTPLLCRLPIGRAALVHFRARVAGTWVVKGLKQWQINPNHLPAHPSHYCPTACICN